jgi:hypothetical protein
MPDPTVCGPDPRELPSSRAAIHFVDGVPGSFWGLMGTTVLRATLVATGIYLAGGRRNVVLQAAVAAGLIEAFALVWVAAQTPPPGQGH